MSREGGRNIRSSGLRFWATVLERFPEGLDLNHFWAPFLTAVEPQMERMALEVMAEHCLTYSLFCPVVLAVCCAMSQSI